MKIIKHVPELLRPAPSPRAEDSGAKSGIAGIPISRRQFLHTTLVGAAIAGVGGIAPSGLAETQAPFKANALPRWRGFNLTDFNSANPARGPRSGTTDDDLKWMVDWGFDFVRLPMSYPGYINYDRSKPITAAEVCQFDERAVDRIEAFVRKAQDQGLHVCLNLHRAPGYCVNSSFVEPYDLWQSKEAQQAFDIHWGMWAKRFKSVPATKVSFDLLNEPSARADLNDQHSARGAVPGPVYHAVAKGAAEAIRAVNPNHLVIADGNKTGNLVTPELKDLNIAQSCRGYFPGQVSHYKAPWANKEPDKCPTPVWPGKIGNQEFSRQRLEEYYKPWIDLMQSGVGVHCGECGCWSKTAHSVFLAWFTDVLDILTNARIGHALWNFRGAFGILDSGRDDVEYEDWHGHKLDAKLLALLKAH